MGNVNVFVSHSHADREMALYLDRTLKTRGARTFIDHEHIGPCDELGPAITSGIRNCAVVLLLWSSSSRSSPWVDKEWRTARRLGKRVIPYVLDGAKLPAELEGVVYLDSSDHLRGHVGLLRSVFGKDYRAGHADPFPGHWRVEVDAGPMGGGFELELLVDGQVTGKTLGIADSSGLLAATAALVPGVLEAVNRPLPVTGAWQYDDRQQNLTLRLTCSYFAQTNTETIVVQTTGRDGGRLRGHDAAGRTYRVWRLIENDEADEEVDETADDAANEEVDASEKKRIEALRKCVRDVLPKDLAFDVSSIITSTTINFFEHVRRHDTQFTCAFEVTEANLSLARFGVRLGILRWVGSARRVLEEKQASIEQAGPFGWFLEGGILTDLIQRKSARVRLCDLNGE